MSKPSSILTAQPSTLDRINIPEIYSFILSHTDKSTQVNLMRTSRLWYELTGPILYRELIYDIGGTQSEYRRNSFAVLPVSSPNISNVSSINSASQDVDSDLRAERTPKVYFLKHCQILRCLPLNEHQMSDHQPNLPAGQWKEQYTFTPATVVLSFVKPERGNHCSHPPGHLCNSGYNDRQAHTIVEVLSPKKLVVKDWQIPCYSLIDHLPLRTSIEKTVIILSKEVLNNPYGPYNTLDPNGHASSTSNSFVFIFQGVKSGNDRLRKSVTLTWVDQLVTTILKFLHRASHHSATVMNSGMIHSNEYNTSFPDAFRQRFFKCTWRVLNGMPISVARSELEELMSRVKFETREEYIEQDPSELEGELDEIEW